MNGGHISVLHSEAVSALAVREGGFYVDGTFGRGGHSRAILDLIGSDGHLLALDCDEEAIAHAKQVFADENRFSILHSNYREIKNAADQVQSDRSVDGVLLDLGVSSPQLDQAQRGFSFDRDGPLDMRMDQSSGQPVSQWLATVTAEDLAAVFREYGEERYARRIAARVIEVLEQRPITTTKDLAEIIKVAHPRWEKHKHPATRCFQALRIFINRELDNLKLALEGCADILRPGGRLVVISFHSLEDRIVKHFIRGFGRVEFQPRGLPVQNEALASPLKKIGRAVRPSVEEIDRNPRSRSSIMRVAEKLA